MYNPRNLRKIISKVASEARKTHKRSAFGIGTTAKKSTNNLILLPIRENKYAVCGAVIVYKINAAISIAKEVDGRVDYVLIDAEQKVKGLDNLVKSISNHVSKSKILTFKGNDITADSTDALLTNLIPNYLHKKIVIMGAGNIGSKVALKLAERGIDVFVGRSKLVNARKIAKSLNLIKPKYCKGRIIAGSSSTIAKDADVLIGFTASLPAITSTMVNQMKRNGIIIDGGIGTIHSDAITTAQQKRIRVLRVDVRPGFAGATALLFETKHLLDKVLGRTRVKGVHIVAGGFYGQYGDVIVDNITRPQHIVGIADGRGGIVRDKLSLELSSKIKVVERWIATKKR